MTATSARPLMASGGRLIWLDAVYARSDHVAECHVCKSDPVGVGCKLGAALAAAERDAWSAWYVARVRDGVL